MAVTFFGFGCLGHVERHGPGSAASVSTKAAILMEGTFDASNRNRSLVSDSFPHGVLGSPAGPVCGPGLGTLEEQSKFKSA